jgi:hypothetical protein
MSLSTFVTITGPFIKFIGEALADLKRQKLADIDLEQLRLRRKILAEKLEDCRTNLLIEVERAKGEAKQDLISRGLANSTVLDSMLRTIDQDSTNELNNATREYNRAIEEIALLERQVREQATPFWTRFLGRRAHV